MFSPIAFWSVLRRPLSVAAAGCCSLLPLTTLGAGSPPPLVAPQTESGVASWHDPVGKGDRRTASHRAWNGDELVAAHKTIPLGTRVRVFNLSNGREVVVVITDRGPFRRGRIIDVSRSAAQKLGLIDAGTAKVRVQRLPPGAS
jgi:rare lipoprotein A